MLRVRSVDAGKLARSLSLSSLGSDSSSSSTAAGGATPRSPRLASRLPELARRARARRDWAPPSWPDPLDPPARLVLALYLVLYTAAWLALFGRDAFDFARVADSLPRDRCPVAPDPLLLAANACTTVGVL